MKFHRWHGCWFQRSRLAGCVLAAAVPIALAASPPVPRELSELAAKARLGSPIAGWCRGEFRAGQPGAFAVAAGGRYVVVESDAKLHELAAYKGGADIACYTPADAERINATIAASQTVHGKVTPRWPNTVVCGFVEDTEATCWQYSPADGRFVEVGGWIT